MFHSVSLLSQARWSCALLSVLLNLCLIKRFLQPKTVSDCGSGFFNAKKFLLPMTIGGGTFFNEQGLLNVFHVYSLHNLTLSFINECPLKKQ